MKDGGAVLPREGEHFVVALRAVAGAIFVTNQRFSACAYGKFAREARRTQWRNGMSVSCDRWFECIAAAPADRWT